jgi:hypothetical protein
MSYPTLRHFDNAAGIVVLLLLIVAVISSQSAISSDRQPVAGRESWTISQSAELANDLQFRENRDDRGLALDE